MRLLFFTLMICISANSFSKPLVVGTDNYNPPFVMLAENGAFYGFDIEIMMAVCKKIKRECVFKPYNFKSLFQPLISNEVNVAISALTITETREQLYLVSLPYLQSNARFLTLKGRSIPSLSSLYHTKVGYRLGSPLGDFANKLLKNRIVLKHYLNVDQLMDALNKGKVKSIILDNVSAETWVSNNSHHYQLIGKPIPFGKGYAIMSNFAQKDLIKEINKALIEIDGTYLHIYNTYFGSNP